MKQSPDRHTRSFYGGSAPGRHPLRTLVVGAILVAGMVLAQGCEDDSGTSAPVCIGFTPAATAESGTVVAQLADGAVCQQLGVDLMVTDVDDVFGLNTTVRYNAATFAYIGYDTVGTVLQQDGADMVPLIREVGAGQIEVGMDRLSDTGIDVVGSAFLLRLRFVIATGNASSSELTLDAGCIWDSNGGPNGEPQPMDGVTCSGGTLIAR